MYSKLSQSDNLLGNPRLQPWGYEYLNGRCGCATLLLVQAYIE